MTFCITPFRPFGGKTAMSAGSQIVPIRIPAPLLQRIEKAMEMCNLHAKGEPYTRSSWILSCVLERLDKPMRRKRSQEKKRQKRKEQ